MDFEQRIQMVLGQLLLADIRNTAIIEGLRKQVDELAPKDDKVVAAPRKDKAA